MSNYHKLIYLLVRFQQKYKLKKNFAKLDRGFTLIELLIVVIIVGLLAAISIPTYFGQVGKARESEAKNNLGSIAKAQQAYHFEKQVFSDDLNKLSLSYMDNGKYYNVSTTGGDFNLVTHKADAIDAPKDQVKNYATGIYFNAGIYKFSICQAKDIFEPVDAPTTYEGNCTNDGIRIK
jgi:type IV pilus assembly protein PilA